MCFCTVRSVLEGLRKARATVNGYPEIFRGSSHELSYLIQKNIEKN